MDEVKIIKRTNKNFDFNIRVNHPDQEMPKRKISTKKKKQSSPYYYY